MSIQKLKEASRKEITSPLTEEAYIIRKLSSYELTQANLSAILNCSELKDMKDSKEKPEGLAAIAAGNQLELAAQRKVLEDGVVSPKIFFGDEEKTPDGSAHVRWLGSDVTFLTESILQFSGLDNDTQEKVAALLKNAHSSAPLTASGTGTDEPPQNS